MPAWTASARASCTSSLTLAIVDSVTASESRATPRFAEYWAFTARLWVTSSAAAAATGSSAAVCMRRPVDNCCWVLAIEACSSLMRVEPVSNSVVVLIRMVPRPYPSLRRVSNRVLATCMTRPAA